MTAEKFTIHFTFMTDDGRLSVPLDAEVELDRKRSHYTVRNFRPRGSAGPPVLPEVRIKKKAGRWVHIDSEKETDLSEAVGTAIDSTPERNRGISSPSSKRY